MRGVVLGICADATLVDITHDIAPQDIVGGALELAAAAKYFPVGTVFLGVVDPGVGSQRRAIAAEAGPYVFVAPDNGLLTMVFRQFAPGRVVELTEQAYALPTVTIDTTTLGTATVTAEDLSKRVQTIAVHATGGTFRLTYNRTDWTAPLPFDAPSVQL